MIKINDKHNCCGCSACIAICPKHCITFIEDKCGFLYPHVDETICINCGLCERVCPVISKDDDRHIPITYAAINCNEKIRLDSSSGGIFALLAQYVLGKHGIVFGAAFNSDWEVEHKFIDKASELPQLMGSKYVQSKIGNSYTTAKEFLVAGRIVLFSGTPCQIFGLKNFLQKEYSNLITTEVVCHGVPSPLVWKTYIDYLRVKRRKKINKQFQLPIITEINFREKNRNGWNRYGFMVKGKYPDDKGDNVLFYETCDKNLFIDLFTKNLCLRPSCYACPVKNRKSQSDFTLGDYWGIRYQIPEWDDDKGTSLVMLHTDKAVDIINKLEIKKIATSYEMALSGNPYIERHADETKYVEIFWKRFENSKFRNLKPIIRKLRQPLVTRIYLSSIEIMKKILPNKILTIIKKMH